MISRQPSIHAGLRIVAAGCIVLWLLAVSHCSIEHRCGSDHDHAEAEASEPFTHHDSDHSEEAEAMEHAHGEASRSHDSGQPSQASHRHKGGEDSCCSTLMAMVEIAPPSVIAKPVLQPLNLLYRVPHARSSALVAPGDKPERHAQDRDWVFMPEVCLGPAHGNHAPPVFI